MRQIIVVVTIVIVVCRAGSLAAADPRELKGHTGAVCSLIFSADGTYLASVGWTGRPKAAKPGFNLDLDFDGPQPSVKLWDVKMGQELATIKGGLAVAFNPDGSVLAVDGALWGTKSGKKKDPIKPVVDCEVVVFSKDWKNLVLYPKSGGRPKFVNTTTGKEAPIDEAAGLATFSSDGKSLAYRMPSPDSDIIMTQDVVTGKEVSKLRDKNFSSGLFDDAGIAEMFMLPGVFSPDGRALATGIEGRKTKLWNVRTGNLITTIDSRFRSTHSVGFSPDSSTFASGKNGSEGSIELCDAKTGKVQATLKTKPWLRASPLVSSVAFAPDGNTLASGSMDGNVHLWDVKTRKVVATLKEHDDAVNCLAFSPDGKILASGSDDKSVRLWDIPPPK